MKALVKNTWVILFILLISFPLFDTIFSITGRVKGEQSAWANFPKFSLTEFKSFAHKFDTFFNNNFSPRTRLFKLYSKFKMDFLKVSPDPANVILGKEGWFFLGDGHGAYNTMRDYRRTNIFSAGESEKLISIIQNDRAYLDSLHIKYYLAVAPNAQTLYPEFLPPNILMAKDSSRLDIIKEKLVKSIGFEIIDLRKPLLDHKNDYPYPLYYKTNTHWNAEGAFIGYREIMKKIKKDFPDIPVVERNSFSAKENGYILADMPNMIGLGEEFKENKISLINKDQPAFIQKSVDYPIPSYYTSNPLDYYIQFKSNKSKYKVLVFRDSFGEFIKEFFPYSFSQSTFIWQRAIQRAIVEKEKPDVVLQLTVERHLDALLY